MSVINNDYQTNLLFKQFTGVAATQLDQQFSNEPYRAIKNIFSRDIFIEEVPLEAPVSIYNLDNSGAWVDSVGALPSVNSSNTFSQVYPDSKLEFYKNIELTAVPGSNSRVWYKLDASNNNILQDTINFKFDDINSTYLMRTKYNNGSVYINNPINSYPLFWVLDNQSGYLQFYSTTAQLLANANIPTNPPKISFFKYVGKKGLLNLDISGQQQVVDISGLDVDISGIQINLNNLNRMILPNGYVDISGGAPWDLCGNEVVRTHYQYTRNNTFIGYGNLPILDGSAVNHSFDPSHNNIIYELDVSGNFYISGHSQLQDVSCNNLDVSGNLTVLGHSQLQDVSCNNLDVSGNLNVLGHSQLQDVSCNNLDVSGNLNVLGHSQLQDVSCNNLDVSGNLTVLGHSQLQDVSTNNLEVSGNIILWNDMSMNGGQITFIGNATDPSGVPSWGQVQAAIDASGGGGDASYNNIEVQGNNLMQSVTIQPWPEPNPIPPNMTLDINYVIATVDISGNSEMSLGYFTLQLGDPYKQVISFYAGVIENKGAFIKIISCTNEDTFNGFKNLKIISYNGTCYLVSTFGRASGGAGDPELLKIILVNNNANRDNPTNNPDWILRNNPDEDWLSDGPLPPETKMPWTGGVPPYPVPTLPPALVTVSLLRNDGQPYGVSTQPEYFQNNIVLDTSANILAGENGTGTVDICGGLYVDRDASFNMDVHVRSSVDISGALTVDSSGTFGGNLFAANTPMIEYIRYDNNNFNSNSVTPSITGSWQTIAQIYPISPLSAQVDTRAAYAIFEIVDRSNNNTNYNFQDNITCMISYTTEECTLNVLSSNPTGNTTTMTQKGYIGNIRLRCGKYSLGGSLPSANLQIKRFCDDTGTGTTDVRVRMYHNFQPMLMPREFTPFVLTSTSLSLTGTITNTEFDVLNYASGFKSSTTKRQYVDKSTMGSLNMEGDISMGTNNITNAPMLSIGNTFSLPRITLNSTTGLELKVDESAANHKITLGDETDTNKQIYMRVNPVTTLDVNYVEISKVNKITSDQTIDISGNVDVSGNLNVSGDVDICGNVIIGGNLSIADLSANNIDVSNDLNVDGILTADTIKNIDLSGTNIDLAATGMFRLKDNNTGASSNHVIVARADLNKVNFGGYDYTGGGGIIGTETARNRVIVDLEAGATQFGLNVADSGSVIQTLGGIKMLPLQSNANGAPPNYVAPGWGASLFLGEWGWGNQSWNGLTTIRLSQRTVGQNYPGSGNVYCNAVRQNIVYTDLNSQGPTWTAGYQGPTNNTMYYNQGDIRYIVVDPKNGNSNMSTVILPEIQSPMLGQSITVTRANVPTTYTGHKTAVYIRAYGTDRINCPGSIFVGSAADFGAIALDPYNDLSGNVLIRFPIPYKGNEICSVTLVASQNGYYNQSPPSGNGNTAGGTITTQFVWQFVSSGSPGI